jgi:neutral ceramidase
MGHYSPEADLRVFCSEAGCAESGPTLRAGAAIADITPQEWPVPAIGNFDYRPATQAHDPLSARALVLDDGTTQIAMVVVDSCYVRRPALDDAKQRASAKTGIPADRIMVSATHTHSAPPSSPDITPVRWKIPEEVHQHNEAYSERLKDGIAQAIADAQAKLQPARLGRSSASVPEELNNRRWYMKEGTIPPDPFGGTTDKVKMNPPRNSPDLIKPAGPTDPEVAMLTVESADGKPLGLLAAYSLHYVGGVNREDLSADYFAEFANRVKQKLGVDDSFVAMMANGTSGDVNNIPFQKERAPSKPYEQMAKVGELVAARAAEAWAKSEWMESPTLGMVQRELTLQKRKPTPEIYEQSKKWLAVEDEDTLPRNAKAYAQRAIDLQEGPDSVDVILQAIRIGDFGIATTPFETFTEIGLEIKEKSPLPRSFTIELANGGEGYLPTPEQHEVGGYETWLGTNRVETEASRKIVASLLEMLGELAKEPK